MGGRHAVDDLLTRGAAGDQIGLRQKRAFGGNVGDLAGQDLDLVEHGHDHRAGQPLREGHGVLHGLAGAQEFVDLGHGGAGGDAVLARTQRPVALVQGDGDAEDTAIGDHALVFQLLGNADQPGTARQENNGLLGSRTRLRELGLKPFIAAIERTQRTERQHDENHQQSDKEFRQPVSGLRRRRLAHSHFPDRRHSAATNTTDALVPPNPKEFDRAARTGFFTAALGARLIAV